MVFLPVFLFAAYANLVPAVRGLLATGRAAILAQLHFMVCMIGALALLLGMELVPDPRKGIAADACNWSVVAFFVFGLLSVIIFGIRLIAQTRDELAHRGPAFRSGMAIWTIVAGLYICGTVVDHWIFFGDTEHAGVVDPSFIGPAVKCHTSVLVRLEGDVAVYRCPTRLAFGIDYHAPFVPWPGFTQGKADGRQLKAEAESVKAAVATSGTAGAVTVPPAALRIVHGH